VLNAGLGIDVRPPRRSALRDARIFCIAIVLAWLAIALVELTGHGSVLHHDAIIDARHPIAAALVFVFAWQAMVAAMMLPSTLPVLRLFRVAAERDTSPRVALTLFVAAYFVVWTSFGVAALAFDAVIHRVVDASDFLTAHEWLVAAATLGLVGAFQFTPWRAQCMRVCRHPFGFVAQHYRPDARGAWALGLRHALFCLGCCWALMLLMFGVGLTNMLWMAALTGVMVYEKVGRHGELVARLTGIVLLAWAALVLIDPTWLPGGV